MKSVNRAVILGRLTRDPQVKYTPQGTAVANLGVATNESYKGKDGNFVEKTEFHDVVLWQRLAEVAGEYLKKGNQVYLEGKLQTRKYTDKSGQERKVTEIVGNELVLIDRAEKTESAPPPQSNNSEDVPF